MLSFKEIAARTRPASSNPIFSSIRRPITTRGNDSERDREKRRRSPSTLMDHAPGWNEELATTSEAAVKADHETTTVHEMQQKTVDYVQSIHSDPEVEQTHATYARDEVSGPLGNTGVGEFEGVVGNDDLGPDHAQVESNGRVVTRRTIHKKTTKVYEGESGAGQANV